MLMTLLFLGSLLLSLAGLAYAIIIVRRSAKDLRGAVALAAERSDEITRLQKASRATSLETRAAWTELSAALSEAQLIRWLDASQPAKDAMLKVEARLFRSMRYLEAQLSREPSVTLQPAITLEPLTPADDQAAKLIMLRSRPALPPARISARVVATRGTLPLLAKTP